MWRTNNILPWEKTTKLMEFTFIIHSVMLYRRRKKWRVFCFGPVNVCCKQCTLEIFRKGKIFVWWIRQWCIWGDCLSYRLIRFHIAVNYDGCNKRCCDRLASIHGWRTDSNFKRQTTTICEGRLCFQPIWRLCRTLIVYLMRDCISCVRAWSTW